ncbi:MAG: hypothetical protein M1818_006100 [Claussenomyces sp. TS43310]|nr:MAG: hypothetical protein M1818_006100 [Claussenomyces sp. TS43310]
MPDRPAYLTLSRCSSHDVSTANEENTSDEEYQHALEVVFDAEKSHRRKDSLVGIDAPVARQHRPRDTACFVHSLLESQRRGGEPTGGLDGIAEIVPRRKREPSTADVESESKDGRMRDLARLIEPKGQSGEGARGSEEDSRDASGEGQPDVLAWCNAERQKAPDATATHSRLLTKRQLSDMAWGVRELSKRLGSIRLKLKVKHVFLLTKAHDESLIHNTREVAKWLLSGERDTQYTVYVEENLKDHKSFDAPALLKELEEERKEMGDSTQDGEGAAAPFANRLRYWNNRMCRARPHTFDFVITLGGDGTVLYASWLFQRIVPPVLSFALGSLGFLTKFDYDDFRDTLVNAFRDGITVSLRLRFEGTIMRSQKKAKRGLHNGLSQDNDLRGSVDEEEKPRDLVDELVGEEQEDERTHRPDGSYEILNDIVVDRGPNPTMSSTEIFGDDQHFTSVQADGICVATPTGSTAYNLAAGGSLCHPENPVILVTAICAHTLNFRPIILPDTIVLRVGVPYDARTSSWASFDGRERVELCPGDYVTISASRYPFANVMPQGRRSEDWVNSISGKLGWNTRQRQKSFKEWT